MPMEFGAASLVLSVVVDSLLELSLLGLLEVSEYDDELSYELLDSEEELSVVADESVAAALLSSAGAAPVSSATGVAALSSAGAALASSATGVAALSRSEEHPSELQSIMRISYVVFCLQKKNPQYS